MVMGAQTPIWRLSNALCVLAVILCALSHTSEGADFGFGQVDYTQTENLGAITVEVAKVDDISGQVVVRITPMTFQAFASSGLTAPPTLQAMIDVIDPAELIVGGRMDFVDTAVDVTFQPSAGPAEEDADITLMDDIVNEAQEGFLIVLELESSDPADTITFTRSISLIRIDDNDPIFISFVLPEYAVSETQVDVPDLVMIEKQNGVESEQDLTVTIQYQDISTGGDHLEPNNPTSIAASDFTEGTVGLVTFSPTDTRLNISFGVIDDMILEDVERFQIGLGIPINPPLGLMLGANPSTLVTINDDEVGIIGFTRSSLTVREDVGSFLVTVELFSPQLISIDAFAAMDAVTVGDTAQAGASNDFIELNDVLFLDGFGRTEIRSLIIIDDNIEEEQEQFLVSLSFRDQEVFGNFEFSVQQMDIFILDDDSIFITPFPTVAGIEGNNVNITCGPLGTDEVIIQVNGVEQSLTFTDDTDASERVFVFGPLDRSQEGTTFQCFRGGVQSNISTLVVYFPPEYTFQLLYEEIEGTNFRIELGLDGNTLDFPSPDTFEWSFNGQLLDGSDSNIILTNNSIQFLVLGRDNAGNYTVSATNLAGTGSASFVVDVFYPPVYTVNNTFVFEEGDFVSIQLDLEANPIPGDNDFTWFFNGNMIIQMPGLTLTVNSITFDMATRFDAGNYTVSSTNVAGTGEGSFQLQITIPPVTTPEPVTTTPEITTTEPETTTPEITTEAPTTPEITTEPPTTPEITTEPPTTPEIITTEPETTTPEITTPETAPDTTAPATTPDPITTPETTTMMRGDPHFEVLVPSGQRLCYSVQGEPEFTFNIVSNKILHMNAKFIQDGRREEVTWIGSLGLVVRSKMSNTTNKIRFEADNKMIYIDDKVSLKAQKIEGLVFSKGRLSISEASRVNRKRYPEVVVDLQDVGLTFTVMFIREHLDVMWTKVRKQPKESHGVVGQFFRYGVEIDETRRLLLLPAMEPVPVMRKPVWHFMEREVPEDSLCWVAMNPGYQGKQLLEGHYLDYVVDDVLSTKFKFKPGHDKPTLHNSLRK